VILIKHSTWGIVLVIIGVFMLLILSTIDGRRIRNQEATDSLRLAIESTIQDLNNEKFNINDNQTFIADFIQALAIQIESNSTIAVNVLDVDYEKGMLSIEVVEHYMHPNGKTGTVACVKTVIFEQDINRIVIEAAKQVKITFLVPGNGTNVIYKEFNVKKGSEIIIPQNPTIEGKAFLQWTLNGSKYILSDLDRNKVKVDEDLSLLAEFN